MSYLNKRLTGEQKEEIRALLRKGQLTHREIAVKYGVVQQTIAYYAKCLGLVKKKGKGKVKARKGVQRVLRFAPTTLGLHSEIQGVKLNYCPGCGVNLRDWVNGKGA